MDRSEQIKKVTDKCPWSRHCTMVTIRKQTETDKFCLQEGPTNDVFDGIILTCLIFWTPIDERQTLYVPPEWHQYQFVSTYKLSALSGSCGSRNFRQYKHRVTIFTINSDRQCWSHYSIGVYGSKTNFLL